MNLIVIIMIVVLVYMFFNPHTEHFNFNSNFKFCFQYGDDYDSCYANPSCTIGFLPNGSTHCMKKFLHEDI